jgi:hypothetical protein
MNSGGINIDFVQPDTLIAPTFLSISWSHAFSCMGPCCCSIPEIQCQKGTCTVKDQSTFVLMFLMGLTLMWSIPAMMSFGPCGLFQQFWCLCGKAALAFDMSKLVALLVIWSTPWGLNSASDPSAHGRDTLYGICGVSHYLNIVWWERTPVSQCAPEHNALHLLCPLTFCLSNCTLIIPGFPFVNSAGTTSRYVPFPPHV